MKVLIGNNCPLPHLITGGYVFSEMWLNPSKQIGNKLDKEREPKARVIFCNMFQCEVHLHGHQMLYTLIQVTLNWTVFKLVVCIYIYIIMMHNN